jgi:hypothetical protein
MFDYFEETRHLSLEEMQVRDSCRLRLAEVIKDRAAYWKQRSKQRAIKEGDANTAYHHAQATQRLRRNNIQHVEVDGVLVANHEAKTSIGNCRPELQYFSSILGTAGQNSWGFDVFQLLHQAQRPTELLTAPFTEDEAKYAVLSKNRSSALGPDGFGPSFC